MEKVLVTCPRCGYSLKVADIVRCPRCYELLIKPANCAGNCNCCRKENAKEKCSV